MQANQIDQTTETEDQNDIEPYSKERARYHSQQEDIQMLAFGFAMQMDKFMTDYFDGSLTNEVLAQRCIDEVNQYQTQIAEIEERY